jgi:hypothetical protein
MGYGHDGAWPCSGRVLAEAAELAGVDFHALFVAEFSDDLEGDVALLGEIEALTAGDIVVLRAFLHFLVELFLVHGFSFPTVTKVAAVQRRYVQIVGTDMVIAKCKKRSRLRSGVRVAVVGRRCSRRLILLTGGGSGVIVGRYGGK